MAKNKIKVELIELSAATFVDALKGKTVRDESGEERCFLTKNEAHGPLVRISDVVVLENIRIWEGAFEYTIEISSGVFESGFMIHGGDFKGGFYIDGGEFNFVFEISGGVFNQSFHINGGLFNFWFTIQGGVFNSSTIVSGGKFRDYFGLDGGNFKGRFVFEGGLFISEIQISAGKFENGLRIDGGDFKEVFNVNGGEFVTGLEVYGGSFNELWLDWGLSSNFLTLANGSFSKIIVRSKETLPFLRFGEELIITFPIHITGYITKLVVESKIASIGSVYINSLYIRNLWFRNFINEGRMDVNRLQPSTKNRGFISVKNTDLGNAIFKETDFRSFQIIHVSNSRLHNITTIGGYFPSHLDIGSTQNKPSEPERSAEAYNQLTLAMQKQGNRDKEVEYYTSYLDWQRKAYLKSRKWSAAGSLYLHKISTEYGSSWIRGAIGTFLVGLFFYFFFLLSLPEVSCCSLQNGWVNFLTNVGYFFAFLLPTHSISFIEGTSLTPVSYIFDFLSRITTGFMIYQTIAAFRRYGKV